MFLRAPVHSHTIQLVLDSWWIFQKCVHHLCWGKSKRNSCELRKSLMKSESSGCGGKWWHTDFKSTWQQLCDNIEFCDQVLMEGCGQWFIITLLLGPQSPRINKAFLCFLAINRGPTYWNVSTGSTMPAWSKSLSSAETSSRIPSGRWLAFWCTCCALFFI